MFLNISATQSAYRHLYHAGALALGLTLAACTLEDTDAVHHVTDSDDSIHSQSIDLEHEGLDNDGFLSRPIFRSRIHLSRSEVREGLITSVAVRIVDVVGEPVAGVELNGTFTDTGLQVVITTDADGFAYAVSDPSDVFSVQAFELDRVKYQLGEQVVSVEPVPWPCPEDCSMFELDSMTRVHADDMHREGVGTSSRAQEDEGAESDQEGVGTSSGKQEGDDAESDQEGVGTSSGKQEGEDAESDQEGVGTSSGKQEGEDTESDQEGVGTSSGKLVGDEDSADGVGTSSGVDQEPEPELEELEGVGTSSGKS